MRSRRPRLCRASGDQRAQPPRPEPGVDPALADRRAPETGGGDRRHRGGPARPPHLQRDPAAERVAGDVRALDPQLARSARAAPPPGWRRSARPRPAAAASAPKPGRSSANDLALGFEQAEHRVPDRLRAAEAVEQQQRLAGAPRSLPPGLGEEQSARRRSGARGSPPPRSRGRSPRGGGSARRSRAGAAAPRRRGSARASGEGRRVVRGDVVESRPHACSVTRAEAVGDQLCSRAGSRRGRRGCWRSCARPSRPRRGGRRS